MQQLTVEVKIAKFIFYQFRAGVTSFRLPVNTVSGGRSTPAAANHPTCSGGFGSSGNAFVHTMLRHEDVGVGGIGTLDKCPYVKLKMKKVVLYGLSVGLSVRISSCHWAISGFCGH